MKLATDKITQMVSFFQQNFLKSSIEDSLVETILQHAQLFEPELHTTIFNQGDEILAYFFLIRGMVGLQKNINKIDLSSGEVLIIESGKVIGEYFNSMHNVREYTAEVKVQCTQIIKIEKKYFHSVCHQLVNSYNKVDRYAHQVLRFSKKIDSFDIFTNKIFKLGSHIHLNSNQIGVILNGQCKILYKPHPNPTKSSLPSIVRSQSKTSYKQIALISQNQWIFTQNLQESELQKNEHFIYIVTSEIITILIMPIDKLDVLPQNKAEMLHRICDNRVSRITYTQRYNAKQNQRHQIIKSPIQLKYSIDDLKKVLQKLDPNTSPNFVLQKHKLSHHLMQSDHQKIKQRTFIMQELFNIMPKQQSLKESSLSCYKNKNWSHCSKMIYPYT